MTRTTSQRSRRALLLLAPVLGITACSTSADVSVGEGAAAGVTAVQTIGEAPSTAAGVVDPATTSGTTATTLPPTTLPPETTTTLPPETTTTLPPETTTTIPLGFEVAPPVNVPVTAIGDRDGDGAAAVQQRLLELGFWLSGVDGEYGTTTTQAVMAFQKYHALPATGSVDQATADAMNVMPYRARGMSTEGDLIEVNKTAQLLFVVRGGRTEWVLNTSTGNGLPYTEEDQNSPGEFIDGVSLTPDGKFKVNRERAEGWWEGDLGKIYRPKYFNGGIAVHGSGSIPNYPASHGCVRVSVAAMDFIWAAEYMPLGQRVWVYS
jgi:Putative peptidoglycan binding domain/L,D-transpeptidase catalytic domain